MSSLQHTRWGKGALWPHIFWKLYLKSGIQATTQMDTKRIKLGGKD